MKNQYVQKLLLTLVGLVIFVGICFLLPKLPKAKSRPQECKYNAKYELVFVDQGFATYRVYGVPNIHTITVPTNSMITNNLVK